MQISAALSLREQMFEDEKKKEKVSDNVCRVRVYTIAA